MTETKTVLEPADLLDPSEQCVGITGKGDRCSNRGRIVVPDGSGVVCALHARTNLGAGAPLTALPEPKPPKPRPAAKPIHVKLRAVQAMFYDDQLFAEGDVFWYEGPPLAETVAVVVDPATPCGPAPEPTQEEVFGGQGRTAPPWTTPGYKEKHMQRAARRGWTQETEP